MTATYSKADIKRHNDSGKLLIIIDGRVYDLTEFANDHPGGDDILREHTNMDATEAFNDVGHPKEVLKEREDFFIGNYKG
ncbi:cytochrome b5-like heme/steroid binding domain-containing protein [Syncephalis fuscata]|nr:cytochrome b5-like heme/steroid binding domain-containing protein [Syncephalis fuscata]